MPKTPNNLIPMYIDTNVAKGCRPSCFPKIFGSKKLLTTLIITFSIISPSARCKFPVPNDIKHQGRMMIPDPIKGIVSHSDVNAAMPIGFFMPIIEKPMINSIKVNNISIKYALIYFKTVLIVYIFA